MSSTSAVLAVDNQAAVASAASKSAATAPSDAPQHPTLRFRHSPSALRAETVVGKGVLLEGTARVRMGLTWFRPTHVQLLAAPALEGGPDAPAWSALVVDGVVMPYGEVAGVRVDESALEFVLEQTPRTTAALDAPPRQHLRMYTRFEFNLWREALSPIIANTTLHAQSCGSISAGSKPSAVHAAQKWLAHAGSGAASCS